MFLKNEFSNRLVQVSLFAGIVYYITAYPIVFEKARKYFPIKFKKTHHLLIFHTFVFAVLMYVLTYFVFDPLVKVVEGGANPAVITLTAAAGNDRYSCQPNDEEHVMNGRKGRCGNQHYICEGESGFIGMGGGGGLRTVQCFD